MVPGVYCRRGADLHAHDVHTHMFSRALTRIDEAFLSVERGSCLRLKRWEALALLTALCAWRAAWGL